MQALYLSRRFMTIVVSVTKCNNDDDHEDCDDDDEVVIIIIIMIFMEEVPITLNGFQGGPPKLNYY